MNATEAITCTVCGAAVSYPDADALIVTVPRFTPVNCACVTGVVAPLGTSTVALMLAIDGSLLLNVTVVPPADAESRITG